MKWISVFKEIIAESMTEIQFREKPLLPRDLEAKLIPGKASVFTGVRRSGKSTCAHQMMQAQPQFDRIQINFSDERLIGCQATDLQHILPAFYELQKNSSKKIVFFFDEIQHIEKWEMAVDRLIRNPHYRVIITGSNSKMLSKEIGTSMRGRSLSYEVFPFSFQEAKSWSSIPSGETAKEKASQLTFLKHYLITGGFPEVAHLEVRERVKILQEYREIMLFRDVLERYGSDPILTQRVVQLLLGQFSSLFTLNKTVEKLKAQGLKASKANVAQIMDWLNEVYLFFYVPIFSESVQKQQVNPKKIYAIDSGLITANHPGVLTNTGRLLENCVFLHLRRQESKIFYWKDSHGNELDFISGNDLIQVCESIENEETRERELKAVRSAMKEFSTKSATLVTLNEELEIKVPEGKIHVRPAWRYLG